MALIVLFSSPCPRIELGLTLLKALSLTVQGVYLMSFQTHVPYRKLHNQVLAFGGVKWEAMSLAGTGTVTSVAVTGSDGIDVDSGSPITGSGTIALGLSNIGIDKIAEIDITSVADDPFLSYDSASSKWVNETISLGAGTVTSVDSGTGLIGGPITGSGTLTVDFCLLIVSTLLGSISWTMPLFFIANKKL